MYEKIELCISTINTAKWYIEKDKTDSEEKY